MGFYVLAFSLGMIAMGMLPTWFYWTAPVPARHYSFIVDPDCGLPVTKTITGGNSDK